MMKAINIEWDTDGENIGLPTEMEFPEELFDGGYDDDVADYLSDQTGFCVESFDIVEYVEIHLHIRNKEKLEGLKEHLSMNGYDVIWVDDSTMLVFEEELSYVETIMYDHNIRYTK